MSPLFLIPIGFVVGAYGTLIGAGGGFVLVPILLFLYKDERPATITSISLAVVFFNALSGSIAYARMRRIDFRTGIIFAVAAAPGSILGALAVGYLSRGIFNVIFGVMLVLIAAYVMLRGGSTAIHLVQPRPGMVTRTLTDANGETYMYRFVQWHGILLSIAVGFFSSLFGIGGGIIHVPAMVGLLHFPVYVATATSHFVLACMALVGTAGHVATGDLSLHSGLQQVVFLSLGVIPGAQLGARLSHRVHGSLIFRLLGGALFLVGLRLALTPLFR